MCIRDRAHAQAQNIAAKLPDEPKADAPAEKADVEPAKADAPADKPAAK